MKKEKKTRGSKIKSWSSIVVLIGAIYSVFGSAFGNIIGGVRGLFGESGNEEKYHNLNIVSVSSEVVSNHNGKTTEEGYQMYRFDLVVENLGTYEEKLSNQLYYVSSGDGYAATDYEDIMQKGKQDTRILPPGRSGVITVYGEVSDDSTTVELETYQTPDRESVYYSYSLPK